MTVESELSMTESRKIILGENEDKNLSLGVILKREFDF